MAAETRLRFREVWEAAAGKTHSFDEVAQRTAAGWTLQMLERMTRLARYAVATDAAVGRLRSHDRGNPDRERLVFERLDSSAQGWSANPSLSLADAHAWLEVLAGSPERTEVRRLYALMQPGGERWHLSECAAWQRTVPVQQAVVAYAAGLSAAEAGAQRAAGALDMPGLRALAALRGYRLLSSVESSR